MTNCDMSRFVKKQNVEDLAIPEPIQLRRIFLQDLYQKKMFLLKIRNISFMHSGVSFFPTKEFEEVMYVEGCDLLSAVTIVYFTKKMLFLSRQHIQVPPYFPVC